MPLYQIQILVLYEEMTFNTIEYDIYDMYSSRVHIVHSRRNLTKEKVREHQVAVQYFYNDGESINFCFTSFIEKKF